jgi:hypothetical protein
MRGDAARAWPGRRRVAAERRRLLVVPAFNNVGAGQILEDAVGVGVDQHFGFGL